MTSEPVAHHDHHHADGPGEDPDAAAAMAELLELDGEVLHDYLAGITSWIAEQSDAAPRRILDLGAGTGTGTIALARQFSDAEVIALDNSAALLSRLQGKVADLELDSRVSWLQVDLDAEWPTLAEVDLAWACTSMHHLADGGRVLADVFATLRPGGLLVVLELDSPPRFLPDDVGSGLEARCQDAVSQLNAEVMPLLGLDWGPQLEQAGFDVVTRRRFDIDLRPPLPEAIGRYARAYLQRIRSAMHDRLEPADLRALDSLLAPDGPDSLLVRTDLVVRGTRTAWLGRRP
ncbi:class I SAM-dependent methyltransferase [Jatrophihabitans lederbergiae]|uniref:Class I SAM-dependent methyltransferase n=1 Tax=Jatrophihabitans lederbergiae TaxID=3075547 RepID=A0ABU2JB10_9ACTN|nr:class I SAM-dependent methyltransferase [Jatrophihabitans sp. DSM 44399]MDT0262166.1 class I SAM-dependent methyltransferase [Jatrophihabitans sp. DSM 44399]